MEAPETSHATALGQPAAVGSVEPAAGYPSLGAFLLEVERRAFRMAQLATGRRDEALDLVQESMLRLAEHYGERPSREWPALFFRILANACRDWHRRRVVRERVLVWFGQGPAVADEDASDDWLDGISSEGGPQEALVARQQMEALVKALRILPQRQQQCFWLRNVEGMDVAETALALGISDGSVKTHYSRAVHRLRSELEEHWP
jgi:RNA polymerase sigma-70 factor (ECF subfamily)